MEQSADSFGFGKRAPSGMGSGAGAVPFGIASPSTSEPFGASASPGASGAASAAGQELESREWSLKAGGFAAGGHAEAGSPAAAPAAAGAAGAAAAAVVAAAAEAPCAEVEEADAAREQEEAEALQEAEGVPVMRSGAPYTIGLQEVAVEAGVDEELAVEGTDEGVEGLVEPPEAEASQGMGLQEELLVAGAGPEVEAEGDEELTEEVDVTEDVLEARQHSEDTAQAQLDGGVPDQGQERAQEQAQEEAEDSYAAAKVAALMGVLGAGAAAGFDAPDGGDDDGQEDEEEDAGLAALGTGENGNTDADVQVAAVGVGAGAPAADEAPSTPAGMSGSQQPGTGSAAASPASTAAPHTPTGSMPRASTLSRSTGLLPPDVASLLAAPSLRGRVVSGSCIENMNNALDVSAAALAASNTSLDAFSRLLEQAQTARVVQAVDGAAGAASAGSAAAGCSTTLCGKARSLQDALQTLLSHAMLLLSDVQASSDAAGPGAAPRAGEEGAVGSPGAGAASAASPSAAKQRNHHAEASAMLEVGVRGCGATAGWLDARGPRAIDKVDHLEARRCHGQHKMGILRYTKFWGTILVGRTCSILWNRSICNRWPLWQSYEPQR